MASANLVVFHVLRSVAASLDHSVFIELPGKGVCSGMIYYLLICLLKDGPVYLE